MYKVFFNQKPIILSTQIIKNDDSCPLFYIKFSVADKIISALKKKSISSVVLYHPKKEKLEMHFNKLFPIVEAAGGLVINKLNQYLFIYRNKKWDLPKGRMRKNEMIIDAAVREVEEETSVRDLIVKKQLPITYHIFKRNRKYKLKKTYWYLMETSYNGQLVPQLNEGIEKAVWKNKNEIDLLIKSAYKNIEVLLNQTL
ncbi:MAG: NUDIX hydrolase [Flavobacteriaceae bacterium]|nr:NUDIX hydrolase [Flavobacteriaceae bacterium]|tara:strand:- start:3563 stop:4159 length:597 start_codon:yes stop_codon:yes gene_type:complete